MKQSLARLLLMACWSFDSVASGLPTPVAEALQRANVPASAAALVVQEVGTKGKPLLAHQADKPMNPASTIKLLTTAAALDLLGPGYRFKTDFLVKGELINGVLEGDLHVRGQGDPKLTYERLWAALRQLRERGLREIKGDIVFDRSHFAPEAHDPSRFDGKARRAYNVGPDALLMNFKTVTLRLIPDGTGVRVATEPPIPSVEVISRIKLVRTGACGDWSERLSLDVQEQGILATLSVEGQFAESCGEKAWHVSLFDHARFSEALLRWLWSEAGGKLLGKAREGETPADARLLHTIESATLSELVRDVNKFSNNVMARQLFLALSATVDTATGERRAGNEARSIEVARNWLKARGIPAPELALDNGSGLSRRERISAASMAALLDSVWKSALMPELVSSLSLLAVDGTYRKRANGEPFAGQAHLKSGTLNDVRALTGVVLDRAGRRWIVALFVNHANAPGAQAVEDALLKWVYDQPPAGKP